MTTTRQSTQSATTIRGAPSTRRVAGVVAAGFLVVASFAALALGAPFGRAAYGGANAAPSQWSSGWPAAIATGLWVLAALHALSRGGVPGASPACGHRARHLGTRRSDRRGGPDECRVVQPLGAVRLGPFTSASPSCASSWPGAPRRPS